MSEISDSLKWELKRNPILTGLDDGAFDAMIAQARPTVFKTRTPLFHLGDPGGAMFLILTGQVKISAITGGGKECILAFLGPGDIIGEMTLLDGAPRTASAEAMAPTRALEVSRQAFLDVLENHPACAFKIIEVLSQRLRATSQMAEDSTLLAAAPRLARAFLRLADSHGREDDGAMLIDLKLSQTMIGSHAGLLRESVNRQMRAWEKDGVIASRDGRIAILDMERLRELADAGLYS